MKFKIIAGLCVFKIFIIAIWLFFYENTNHPLHSNDFPLNLNSKKVDNVEAQSQKKKEINKSHGKIKSTKPYIMPYQSEILSSLKMGSHSRKDYIDKEIVVEKTTSGIKGVMTINGVMRQMPEHETRRFIIHVNYADDFKKKYTGFGMRFGMAIPDLCPIDPVVSLGPGLILGVSGNYNVFGSNPYNISQDIFESYIDESFSTWINSSGCNNTVDGWNISTSGFNDSTAVFQRNNNNDFLFFDLENESILAVTILWLENQPGGLAITEADVILNSNIGEFSISDLRNSSVSSVNSFNLFDIILHEIGHFIGMGHTPGTAVCNPAIMSPSLQSGIRKEELTEADRAGIRNLLEIHGLCSSSRRLRYWNIISLFISCFLAFSSDLF